MSCNLQANYIISFLFYLDLTLHACKISLRCDSFGILNFTTKQGLNWFGWRLECRQKFVDLDERKKTKPLFFYKIQNPKSITSKGNITYMKC